VPTSASRQPKLTFVALVARGEEGVLETHRRDIVVVFCDLRGFTAFAETAEPEDVLALLREYPAALGPIVSASEQQHCH